MKTVSKIVFVAIGVGFVLSTNAYVHASVLGASYGQLAKLTASDAAAGDYFGYSVAISGSTAIVGAYGDSDAGHISGSAYLFDVSTGTELAKLTASDAAASDQFGLSVAISGNRAIVGAYGNDDNGSASGSAYIFDVTSGAQLNKLTASDAADNAKFGHSVAISGNIAIVGAYGDQDAGAWSGAAYLFDTTTGNQLAKLTPSDASASKYFGRSVAISGNIALVGADFDSEAGNDSGAAYLFDVTTGNQLAKLIASDATAHDLFGTSVAIDGNIAIVGAEGNDDAGLESGSAYLFDVTTGTELAKLTASDAAVNDLFGRSVAVSGNVAAVGSFYNDDSGESSGAAYLFDVATGDQLAKLTASDAAAGDWFGYSVAVSDSIAVVGSTYDDNPGQYTGSAYLYTVPEPTTLSMLAIGGLALIRRRK